jgi:hypothetical protein
MKKLLTTLAVLTVIATPAFAQSFDPAAGTGNVLSFSSVPTAPQQDKIAARQSGLQAYAMIPGSQSDANQSTPALTGGGSTGYNEMLLNH